ncbi:MAG TPA: methyltransferase domain-containing protein [Polyangiaceae bacterium]
MFPSEPLTAAEAAVLETFVVPRYLERFAAPLLEMLLPTDGARVAHVGCRTGYPDREICQRVPHATVYGVDRSAASMELARHMAAAAAVSAQYLPSEMLPTTLPAAAFSHVISLHPSLGDHERGTLFSEMARLIYVGGQALVALPMRGSFQEIGDLFREYALKNDDGDLSRSVDEAMASFPTLEILSDELEAVGLEDVDVELRHETLRFENGRSLLEDPSCRLLVIPDLKRCLAGRDLVRPLEYLREAVDRYWSETQFELTVNIGCASARKVL